MNIVISDDEMNRRRDNPPKRPDHPATGVLKAYRQAVSRAEKGAVWI